MSRLILLAILLFGSMQSVLGIVEQFGTKVLVQPDGTQFTVREFVDEFGHYLSTPHGYVVKDASTGYYYYFRYDSTGGKSPSSVRAGIDDGSSALARLKQDNTQALSAWQQAAAGAAATSEVTLPDSLIVLLVEFSDVKHQNPHDWPMVGLPGGGKGAYPEYTVSHFETMLFGSQYTGFSPDNEPVYGSMRQYWADMSKESYTLKGRVANRVKPGTNIPIWITLGDTKSNFHTRQKDARAHFRRAALDSAASQQKIDVSRNARRIICIIYAGNMYVDDPTTDTKEKGLHPSYELRKHNYTMSERWAYPVPEDPRNVERNYANFSHIGVHCHEFGHVLGLGDKYATRNNPHNRDYHKWGLMADGGNKKVGSRGDNPAPLSPHHRAELGWLTPTNVTGLMENETLSYSSARASYQDDVYRIKAFTNPSDFFLIENRQLGEGWNRGPASADSDGLLIWHIRDINGRKYDFIDLVEADNNSDDSRYNSDLFPGSAEKTAFTDFTSPSSKRWGPTHDPAVPGENSNVRVVDIRPSGTNLTADLSPFWAGTIESVTWSGTVKVGGDVTVASGDTLTVAAGTEVLFLANRDDTNGGSDATKAELIVAGTLNASAGNITFRSANSNYRAKNHPTAITYL